MAVKTSWGGAVWGRSKSEVKLCQHSVRYWCMTWKTVFGFVFIKVLWIIWGPVFALISLFWLMLPSTCECRLFCYSPSKTTQKHFLVNDVLVAKYFVSNVKYLTIQISFLPLFCSGNKDLKILKVSKVIWWKSILHLQKKNEFQEEKVTVIYMFKSQTLTMNMLKRQNVSCYDTIL